MTTLTDFLRDKYAEDEAWLPQGDCFCSDDDPFEQSRPDCSDRLYAEIQAKRRIVERWGGSDTADDPTLAFLALPYADHPDYREGWRS